MMNYARHAFSLFLAVCLASSPGRAAPAEPTADATAWLQFIGLELRQLRLELLEHSLSKEAAIAPQLEQDLTALRLELKKKQSEEGLQLQQLTDLEKQAVDPAADAQARGQIQAARNELASSAETTRAVQSSLAAREAALHERLRVARARLQSITDRLKQLGAPQR